MKFYSASTNGFYDPEINSESPTDAVEITDLLYQSLLIDQTDGKIITADSTGYPISVDPPSPNKDQTIVILTAAVQQALDKGALAWGYDSIVSAASYSSSSNPQYAADAKALIDWRDATWAWAYPAMDKAPDGMDPIIFLQGMPNQPKQPTV